MNEFIFAAAGIYIRVRNRQSCIGTPQDSKKQKNRTKEKTTTSPNSQKKVSTPAVSAASRMSHKKQKSHFDRFSHFGCLRFCVCVCVLLALLISDAA